MISEPHAIEADGQENDDHDDGPQLVESPLNDPEPTNERPIERNKSTAALILVLIISILLGLVTGTLYGFGRYAKTLKEVLNISQSRVQQFGIWLDCGNYIGHPVTGMIYDRYGPSISCLLGGLIVFVSYAAIHMALVSDSTWLFSLNLAFAGVGFGSGLGYISGLGSTTAQFSNLRPQFLARAVALVAAGYGLSSTLVGLTFQWLTLSRFFLFWGLLVAAVNGIASVFFHCLTKQNDSSSSGDDDDNENQTLLQEPLLATEEEEGEIMEPNEDVPEVSIQLQEDDIEHDKAWNTWRHLEFWLLVLAFSCVGGCGLFVINNLSLIAQSLGLESEAFAGALIIILSISNVLGRIIMGGLGDYSSSPVHRIVTKRLGLLQLSSFLMTLALLFMAIGSIFEFKSIHHTYFLVIMVIMVAVAYGGSWVLIAATLPDLFGTKNYGKDYGLLAMGPALSGMLFNAVSARWYEQHTTSETVCTGSNCYQSAFLLTGGAAMLGCLLLKVVRDKQLHER